MLHMWVYVSHVCMLRSPAWAGNFWDVIKGQKQQSNRHPEGWCGGPVLIQMTALTSKTSKQCKPQHWQKTLWGSAEAVHDQSRHCLMVKTFSSLITTVRGKKKKERSHLHPQAPVNWGNKTPSKSSSLVRKETVHQKMFTWLLRLHSLLISAVMEHKINCLHMV